ncbi:MAG: tripartite tricarboxylate transporter substrate binding protein [Pseudolabrys sp.]|nr:tripartite tricarboxylate transporter substrate binding protein [Pseudolabrys sp.]
MRIFRFTTAVALTVAALSSGAKAQTDYPNRVIHVVVGFAAGGGNDIFARVVGQKLEQTVGGTVVVDNKPGAGGRIASEFVAHQTPDGYTLLVGASGQMSIAAAIYPNLGYHPTKSFIPLNMIASFPLVMVVPGQHQVKNVADLIKYAKDNPDKANYASSSPAFTIASELLKLKTGMPGTAIPYKGTNESTLSVVSEQSLFTIADGPPTIPLVKGGQLRAIAVTGSERSSELPDVPSMKEAGYPQVDTKLWSGFFAPAGTPAPVVEKLRKALAEAIADASVRDKLKTFAVNPGGPTGAEFGKWIDDEIKSYDAVVKAANLKFEQ